MLSVVPELPLLMVVALLAILSRAIRKLLMALVIAVAAAILLGAIALEVLAVVTARGP
ncbi:hypothetical protein [Pseudonocardia sp.]|uniref:hypothetical protein n=1 Tax=Pseudonocardia sp. TaxID=60912 RepID=UPI00261DF80F|nr:hypothetical protein [Pseudonocardia sp.]